MSIHFEINDNPENTYVEYNLVFTDPSCKANIIDQYMTTRKDHLANIESGKIDEMIDAIENSMTPVKAFSSYVEAFIE